MPTIRNKVTGELVEVMKYQNKLTGEVGYFDNTGKHYPELSEEVSTEAASREELQGKPFSPGITGVRPTNVLDQALDYSKYVEPALTVAGGLVTKRPFLGAMAGSLTGQLIQHGAINAASRKPSTPLNPIELTGNALIDAVIDKGLTKFVQAPLANAIASGVERYKEGGLRNLDPRLALKEKFLSLFTKKNLPEDIASIEKSIDQFQPTMGQVTGSKSAKFIEQAFAPKNLAERQNFQRNAVNDAVMAFRKQYTGIPSPSPIPQETFGRRIQTALKGERTDAGKQVRAAYQAIDAIKDANKIQIMEYGEGIEPVVKTIVPVTLTKSKAISEEEGKILDKIFSNSNVEGMPPYLQARYKRAKDLIEDIRRPTVLDTPSRDLFDPNSIQYLRDYDVADKAHSSLGKILYGKDDISFTNEERVLNRLYKALGEDIHDSMASWPKGGQDALMLRGVANSLAKEKAVKFDEGIRKLEGTRRGPADPSKVLQEAYTSREDARKLINAVGPENIDEIRGGYYEHLIGKAYNPASKTLDPDKMIQELADPNSGGREILSSKHRSELTQLARSIRVITGEYPQAGRVALEIRGASLGFSIGTGLVRWATGGSLPASATMAAGAGTGIYVTGRNAAKALMDPENVKLALRLAKVKPGNPESNYIAKRLLLGMKGTEVMLNIPNFGNIKAIVNEQGKVQPELP